MSFLAMLVMTRRRGRDAGGIFCGADHDVLSGGDGWDTLGSGAGNDTLYGGGGFINDFFGGAGDDVLHGHSDYDRMNGAAPIILRRRRHRRAFRGRRR